MARFVLDTNTVSHILRRNATAITHLSEAARNGDDVFMCPVVFYEIWRGLRDRRADRQIAEFTAFAQTLRWIDYDRSMWVAAAELWAGERRRDGHTTMPTC